MSTSSEIKDIRRKCLLNQTEFAVQMVSLFHSKSLGKEKAIPNYAVKENKDF